MITIYTLRPEGRVNPWLDECLASVPEQFPHKLINVAEGDFFSARKLVYTNNGNRNGYVACLDWDDVLHAEGAAACDAALKAHSAGCAFTFQEKISNTGARLSVQDKRITRLDVSSVPESIHHLCVINSSYLPVEIFDVIERVAPLCVDWLIRAYVALRFGAVQVPVIGYSWRMHESQSSRTLGLSFAEQIPYARALARSWAPRDCAALHEAFPRFTDAHISEP